MSVEKKVLIVIAPVKFRDEELSEPIKYLEKAGIGYDIISTQTGLAIGMLGGKVLIEKTVRDVSEAGITPYAGILIVGGGGSPDHLWNNKPLQTLVQEFDAAGKILSAICLSTVVLAQAGVLKGKQATVWNDDAAIHQLRQGGATYKPDPIVSDGRVITANGPPAAAGFGEKVAKAVLAA
ncbi:ThiJ/PfpI [Methanospirillum hungatei JF-1]|jgi:protease I|uniref:ThiJ/PfpI n=1 Tax=Methanospirillum hungatei JF-1 (strain ATCC 27890 / DSM 864 / NBRC 100397 / JF-1) TaxID=323259 RepID=Q2FRF8_METHJ|nr:DJ-1/PfpI family protein [Methanospirillum hungatei]ABD41353.1 ThiJ/PfpI [Methanospirillum hungatei JF-1]